VNEERGVRRYQLFIDGQWLDGAGGWIDCVNPYDGKAWAQIPRATTDDVSRTVAAAQRAFESDEWRSLTPTARGALLRKLGDLIAANAEQLAQIETRDNGKLYAEMYAQLRYVPQWFYYFGGLADKVEGAVYPTDKPDTLSYSRYEPLGVVVAITAWNSPLLLAAYKLAPALAAGNTVILKPSEHASASSLEFARLVEQAGFPRGVVNVITGFGAEIGDALTGHPSVRKVTFTGSEATGRHINEVAGADFKRVTLELGGKSPNIVFEDADLEQAATSGVAAFLAASGQTCVAGSRLLVQASVYDAFMDRLLAATRKFKVGNPLDLSSEIGAVTSADQLAKNLRHVADAEGEGARLVSGGRRNLEDTGGFYMEPTIFDGVEPAMKLVREEVFGPVLAVSRFEDEAEAVRLANATVYGLASAVWTSNLSTAHRMVRAIRAGVVHVNTYGGADITVPLGGFGQSGFGRDKSLHAFDKYTDLKTAWISLA
jgi:aldehyde dehydrogenase (NAD+)